MGKGGAWHVSHFPSKSNYKPKNPLSISLIENFIHGEITSFQIYFLHGMLFIVCLGIIEFHKTNPFYLTLNTNLMRL